MGLMKPHWKYCGRFAQVVALVYISACIVCFASVPLVDLMVLFCSGEPSVAKYSFKANSRASDAKVVLIPGHNSAPPPDGDVVDRKSALSKELQIPAKWPVG